jgi:hypothetical protein
MVNSALKSAMHAVKLEHVGQVISGFGIVDTHDLYVFEIPFQSGPKGQAAYAAKTVDAKLDGHGECLCQKVTIQ